MVSIILESYNSEAMQKVKEFFIKNKIKNVVAELPRVNSLGCCSFPKYDKGVLITIKATTFDEAYDVKDLIEKSYDLDYVSDDFSDENGLVFKIIQKNLGGKK